MLQSISVSLFLAPLVLAGSNHHLKDCYRSNDFLSSAWHWETFDDPTHGRVNYVDQQTATEHGLAYVKDDKFFMHADSSKVVNPYERGRDSIRITSEKAYGDSIIIIDVTHMPVGCGTWPAFWTLSHKGPWPHGGEIDIIEGVNLDDKNLMSLHTTPDCSVPQDRPQTGSTKSTNCDTAVDNNTGCGTSFNSTASYGSGFNSIGGGFFAMQRSDEGIKGWFWPRDSHDIPNECSGPNACEKHTINSDGWGTPAAFFPTDHCNYQDHFDEHSMVFDLTFCGDWAGSTYSADGRCPGSCIEFVDNNPDSFRDAYWEINSLRVYAPN